MLLRKSIPAKDKSLHIGGSKSISNRLLILNKLFERVNITNLSTSQDTQLLMAALEDDAEIIDIHHAGTAMRFLTSYFAIDNERQVILTGSSRMKERPIFPLVNALRDLGADIEYLENDGYPPIKIRGAELKKNSVEINANVSSQFITSLMLIGAKIKGGLKIILKGEITSRPYLDMTMRILKDVGIKVSFENNEISIGAYSGGDHQLKYYEIESDWSSASYYYSLAAIGRTALRLTRFGNQSMQGDAVIKQLYWDFFGVNTVSDSGESSIQLYPQQNFTYPEKIVANMNDCPDIAQTLCVTAAALKIHFDITGLKTLKIKETDRLAALKNELAKLGCITQITDDRIYSVKYTDPEKPIVIKTYNDHRMAMSFAPYCLINSLEIENPDVVDKSYPEFWEHFKSLVQPEPKII